MSDKLRLHHVARLSHVMTGYHKLGKGESRYVKLGQVRSG